MFALGSKEPDPLRSEGHRGPLLVCHESLARLEQIPHFGSVGPAIGRIKPNERPGLGSCVNDIPDVPPDEPVDIGSHGGLGIGLGDHGVRVCAHRTDDIGR